jgi:P2-related tail formation protein
MSRVKVNFQTINQGNYKVISWEKIHETNDRIKKAMSKLRGKFKFKEWFYEWKHGHPFLLNEEVEIICRTREEPKFKHLNDREIQTLIAIRISNMYEKKYPNAKRWSLAHF